MESANQSVFRTGLAIALLAAAATTAAAPEQTMSSPPKVKAETRAGHPPAGTAATPRCPFTPLSFRHFCLCCLLREVYGGRARWGRREADTGKRAHLLASADAFKPSLGLWELFTVWIRPLPALVVSRGRRRFLWEFNLVLGTGR